MKVRNEGLLVLAAVLIVGSFLIGSRQEGAEFAGADVKRWRLWPR
jgi:hypothetical protein